MHKNPNKIHQGLNVELLWVSQGRLLFSSDTVGNVVLRVMQLTFQHFLHFFLVETFFVFLLWLIALTEGSGLIVEFSLIFVRLFKAGYIIEFICGYVIIKFNFKIYFLCINFFFYKISTLGWGLLRQIQLLLKANWVVNFQHIFRGPNQCASKSWMWSPYGKGWGIKI